MNLTIISDIAQKYSEEIIQKNCKLIQKKISIKSANDLGHITELVTALYICNKYDDAIKVCDLLNDIDFNGNYTLWDNVENARLVKVRILRNSRKEDEADKIIEALMTHESINLWKNQVQCLTLYDKNISEAKQRKSSKDIISWQLIKYEMMIRFVELPGFPVDKAFLNSEICNLSEELRGRFCDKGP